MFFCQNVLCGRILLAEERLGRSRHDAKARLVLDRKRSAPVSRGRVWWMPYVDNANIWGWCREDVVEAIEALRWSLNQAGLVYRVECPGEDEMDAVGLVFSSRTGCIVNKPSRVWKLHRGPRALADVGRATHKVLQVCAGLATHALGLRRCCLSALQHI